MITMAVVNNIVYDDITLSNIKVVSFNMHGFAQGIAELNSLCRQRFTDVIFLQELWLPLDQIYNNLSCFGADYFLFAASAMDDKVKSGILRGRPFGGLCTLLNKKTFSKFQNLSCFHTRENFIIVAADNLTLINVYFPSSKSTNEREFLSLLLDDLLFQLEALHSTAMILGGDLNCNILNKNFASDLINTKLNSIELYSSYQFVKEINNKQFSFSVPKRKAFTLIDFFLLEGVLVTIF